MNNEKTTFSRDFRIESHVTVGNLIENIRDGCLYVVEHLLTLTLSRDSIVRVIDEYALGSSSLQSLCIPASVEIIPEHCFADCNSLSSVTFKPWCRLRQIERSALLNSALESICIPSLLKSSENSVFLAAIFWR
jgi:hypothetical protein